MKFFHRGAIVYVDLNPAKGHEQAGKRPALVISNDKLDWSRSKLVTVLPITTRERELWTRIAVDPREGGLKERSWVIGEQVRTISTERIIDVWGNVRPPTIAAVEKVLRFLFALRSAPGAAND